MKIKTESFQPIFNRREYKEETLNAGTNNLIVYSKYTLIAQEVKRVIQ